MATRYSPALALLIPVLMLLAPGAPRAQHEEHPAPAAGGLAIPGSVRTEHEAIHSLLVEATKAPGQVGEAARALAKVLHPHFVREEEIALPPLGLLAPLAGGKPVSDADAKLALSMSDALRSELPGMLEEHARIREAVKALHDAAVAEKSAKFQELAEALALHAQTEEDVFYPAAILVGDMLRARQKK